MSNCSACSSRVTRRLSKVLSLSLSLSLTIVLNFEKIKKKKISLRNIRNLSMPGSKIPRWFSQEAVRFTNLKNREIKGVIIGVVVSLNQEISDDLRYRLPAIVDIQAEIRKLDYWIYKTTLHLNGIPKTNEDQIHLC
ncbi:hypothetical protein CFP56_009703 [Quercus suber]|uniref:Uncharacterized protein n=1 Tax=Quercus suber TaxID=58331 RepID=A0AAW0L2H4_QUESU